MKILRDTQTVPSITDRFVSNEHDLIINVAARTVLRQGVKEPSNMPNTLVKIKWTAETLDWHSDKPLLAVVRIQGGHVWLDGERGYCPLSTHVYDISGLVRQEFPYGSIAAQHGYAGTHWAGRAQRLIHWEGR